MIERSLLNKAYKTSVYACLLFVDENYSHSQGSSCKFSHYHNSERHFCGGPSYFAFMFTILSYLLFQECMKTTKDEELFINLILRSLLEMISVSLTIFSFNDKTLYIELIYVS